MSSLKNTKIIPLASCIFSLGALIGCAQIPEYVHPADKPSATISFASESITTWGINKGTVYFRFNKAPPTVNTPLNPYFIGYYKIMGDVLKQENAIPAGENLLFQLTLNQANLSKFYTCDTPFRFSPKPGKRYVIQFELDDEDDNYSCEAQLIEKGQDAAKDIHVGSVKEYATVKRMSGVYRVDNAPLKVPQF